MIDGSLYPMDIAKFIVDRNIRAAIFDMDGVLIDSEPFWQDVEVSVFQSVGVPLTAELAKSTVGLRVDEVTAHWFARFPWQHPSQDVVTDRIVQAIIERVRDTGQSKDGVDEAITLLRSLGCSLAVASSSYQSVIDAVLEKLNLARHFVAVHSAEHEPQGKPHPGVFLSTAKKLGINPRECLVFEDSPNGVAAAKAAGMYCIAVPDKAGSGGDSLSVADVIIPSLRAFASKRTEGTWE